MSSDPIIFMMGKYEAALPADRWYADNHHWLKAAGPLYRVGFTSYAVRLLQDVYFLDWSIDPDTAVRKKQEVGEIETSKAVASLYAPVDARILRFNPALMNDPSLINTDNYEAGWLYEIESTAPMMSVQDYLAHLNATWESTQKTLKGQYNEAE
jgi:glycine cleavage system H protein